MVALLPFKLMIYICASLITIYVCLLQLYLCITDSIHCLYTYIQLNYVHRIVDVFMLTCIQSSTYVQVYIFVNWIICINVHMEAANSSLPLILDRPEMANHCYTKRCRGRCPSAPPNTADLQLKDQHYFINGLAAYTRITYVRTLLVCSASKYFAKLSKHASS